MTRDQCIFVLKALIVRERRCSIQANGEDEDALENIEALTQAVLYLQTGEAKQ